MLRIASTFFMKLRSTKVGKGRRMTRQSTPRDTIAQFGAPAMITLEKVLTIDNMYCVQFNDDVVAAGKVVQEEEVHHPNKTPDQAFPQEANRAQAGLLQTAHLGMKYRLIFVTGGEVEQRNREESMILDGWVWDKLVIN